MSLILAEEAYCGPAPTPESLAAAWNLDPLAFALMGLLIVVGRQAAFEAHGRRAPFWLSMCLLAILFVSPLCALTTALFSARVVHHVVLVALAAPLLALAFPARGGGSGRVGLAHLVALHTIVLWFWHAPAVYAFGIAGAAPYWLMQASLLGSALLMWRRILAPDAAAGGALLALLANVIQMGMLGALLTFSPQALYEPHLTTTIPFGLSPLQDQHLGGLVMWVPATLPYVAVALFRLAALLRAAPAPGRSRPAG